MICQENINNYRFELGNKRFLFIVKISITYNLYLLQAIQMGKEDRSEVIEQGDIFFFYRPKVDAEEVENNKMSRDFIWLLQQKKKRNKMTFTGYFC
jgi:hypothetical protein